MIKQQEVDNLVLELVEKNLVADEISLAVGYSRDVWRPTGGSRKLPAHTSSYKSLVADFVRLYQETTDT